MFVVCKSFQTNLTYTPPTEWTIFFSDLVNLVRMVTFDKQHVGYNVMQACCMGNHCLLESFHWEA